MMLSSRNASDSAVRASVVLTVMLVAPAILSALAILGPFAAAQTADWVIDKPGVTLDDQNKVMSNSIIVEKGGGLAIRNSTVIFNLTKNAAAGILVQPGGTLEMFDSKVLSGNPANSPTFVSYGNLTIDNCDITGLWGHFEEGGGVLIQSGLVKITDSIFENNKRQGLTVMGGGVTVRGSTFKGNMEGVTVKTVSGLVIESSIFSGNTQDGILGVAAGVTIKTSTFTDNNIAIGLSLTEATIKGNTINRNRIGIDLAHVNYATVESNKITGNTEVGIRTASSSPVIKDNELSGNAMAMNLTGGKVTLTGNNIVNNNNGVFAKGVTGDVGGNIIGGHPAYGLYIIGGNLNILNNNYTPDNARGRVAWAWKLNINVSKKGDSGPERVIGADIEVFDIDGKIEFSGVTNATGSTRAIDIVERYIDNTGAEIDANPHQLKASYKSLKAKKEFNMRANMTAEVNLTKASSGAFPTSMVLLGAGVLVIGIAAGVYVHMKYGGAKDEEREPRIKREASRRRHGRSRSLTTTAASRRRRVRGKKGRR